MSNHLIFKELKTETTPTVSRSGELKNLSQNQQMGPNVPSFSLHFLMNNIIDVYLLIFRLGNDSPRQRPEKKLKIAIVTFFRKNVFSSYVICRFFTH